jgi:hypothetical protein
MESSEAEQPRRQTIFEDGLVPAGDRRAMEKSHNVHDRSRTYADNLCGIMAEREGQIHLIMHGGYSFAPQAQAVTTMKEGR